ncbi:PHD-type domain-containing protein [Citrus sinensis]|uniref:PHD-type domain-containing protein n=1 Tax=Citrus sinensis TaxID=2711 RepID=A0ACB8JPS0_CITSI|nr:PHD-type domain-containing protein [Citrus sinensis]
MKRELDYELAGSLDETSTQSLPQAGIQASDCVKAACENVRCKRFKVTKVNGFIVYSRVKRSRFSNSDDLLEDDVIDKRINSKIHEGRINKVVKNVLNENGILESVVEEENQLVQMTVENVIEETVKGKKAPICKEEPISKVECFPRKEGGSEVSNGLNKKCLKRPSAMKPKVEPVEVLVTQSEGFGNESMSLIEVEAIAEGSALTSPKKNLELKMSKKISLNKKPMTVTELFETGLLDGVSVVYMGGIKFQASGLRGIIRDGGILCSCSLCNGCRVIPPSKFEIHACKQYRRASQYICFENGKSLLEVLRACRSVPLPMLKATLQSALSSLPEEKSFACVRCKGTFPITCVGKTGPGPLCNSCVKSKKPQGTMTYTTGIRIRLLEADLVSKSSSKSVSLRNLLKTRSPWELTRKSKKTVLISKPFENDSPPLSFPNKSRWNITPKDQRLHKLVFDESGLPDGTEVGYYACGQKLLEGYKNGLGIICHCCNSEVSPSQFEAHAGWSSRRKPYAHIYTSNGVSLHQLAISLSKGRQYPGKDNDDLCTICADGGNLLPCDGCPRAFHKECASLSSIPQGDWYCKYCQNMFERKRFLQHDANAVEAGRVSGVDSVEQITKRCIRIVKNLEAELSGCLLCRGCDFSKSGFGPRTILLCDQCEREFHVGCLKKHKMADLRELPKGKWFCCMDCSRINSVLQNLLVQEAEKLPEFHLNAIKKYAGNSLETVSDIDVRWQLLSGKAATPETRLLLSQAVAIFHDCFDPIVDSISGRDLIPSMVYGRNLRGQEFGGMYCAILTVNSSVVSAGILRVFGQEVAELPLVATSKINHGKLLSFLRVKSIVLPAAEEAESIWTDKFGFKKIDPELLSIYRKRCSQLVTFKGTSMLQKRVPACRIGSSSTDSTECVSGVEVG